MVAGSAALAAQDVKERIAWIARMSRLCADPRLGLADLATLIGSNKAQASRLETGRYRRAGLLGKYEDAFGLPIGSLQAPIDVMCRTFPSTSPGDHTVEPPPTVRELSALTEPLLDACGAGVAGDLSEDPRLDATRWYVWAKAMSSGRARGLPESLARSLIGTLISQLSRSVGVGYPMRYEALARLRCSDYGYLVVEVAKEWVAQPDVQVLWDVMSAVAERASHDVVNWCLELLDDPRDRVFVGAVLALENMGSVANDPDDYWSGVTPHLVKAYGRMHDEPSRWIWLSHLMRLLPTHARPSARELPTPLAPRERPTWSKATRSHAWAECVERSAAITSSLCVKPQPTLTHLLFDFAYGPHETRGVTSGMLLGALHAVAIEAGAHVAQMAHAQPDLVLRGRAARRLAGSQWGLFPSESHSWLEQRDTELLAPALLMAGAAGVPLTQEQLSVVIGSPDLTSQSTYALGMGGDPRLSTLAVDGAQPIAVRAAAMWWLEQGPRVVA